MRLRLCLFFFSSRRRHTRCGRDWSSDVCSSDLTYHFSNLGVCSWYDFAQMIFHYSNNRQVKVNPIKTEHFPTPARRPAYSVMDVSDIIHAFDLDIPYWTDSLQKCLKELRKL